jgi:hypothetical protein
MAERKPGPTLREFCAIAETFEPSKDAKPRFRDFVLLGLVFFVGICLLTAWCVSPPGKALAAFLRSLNRPPDICTPSNLAAYVENYPDDELIWRALGPQRR